MESKNERIKRAQLLSTTGALALGIGLGLLLPGAVGPMTIPILVAGLLAHGWGMFETHLLERSSEVRRPRWAGVLYWVCWLALIGLGGLIVVRLSGVV
jgi:hypothetical protein